MFTCYLPALVMPTPERALLENPNLKFVSKFVQKSDLGTPSQNLHCIDTSWNFVLIYIMEFRDRDAMERRGAECAAEWSLEHHCLHAGADEHR